MRQTAVEEFQFLRQAWLVRMITRFLAGHSRDAVMGLGEFFGGGLIAELHQVGIFGRVVVEITQYRDGFETEVLEEQLCFEVRLADFEHDPVAAFVRKLAE